MTSKVDQLYAFVQERCLWQFFSRSWDRRENLEGVFGAATEFLTGKTPKRETPMDKLFYADAKILVKDFEERFPWIREEKPDEIVKLIEGVKARVWEISIEKSLNGELNNSLY